MRHPLTLLAQPATLVFVVLSLQNERDDGLVTRVIQRVELGKAEPDVVVAPRRIVVVTIRRTAVLAVVDPRATAQHTVLAYDLHPISILY